MKQIEIFIIPSPCIGVCQVNARGYCLGCARSRDERFYWQKMEDAQKKEVLRLCRARFERARRNKQQEHALKEPEKSSMVHQQLDAFSDEI